MKRYFLTIIFALFLILLSSADTKAAPLKIKYNNIVKNYKGKQVICRVDNKKINMQYTKGVLINGTVMVSYKDVIKSGLGISCKYTKSNGSLVIKGNGKKITLKLNNKKAKVNGKSKTLKQGPTKVKYIKKKKTKIWIPMRFVVTNLGYTYNYNKTNGEVNLTSPFVITYNSSEHIYKKYKGNVVYNDVSVDLKQMPLLNIGGCSMVPAEQLIVNSMGLSYSFNSDNGQIVIDANGHSLIMNLGQTTAMVDNSLSVQLKNAPLIIKRNDTEYSCVMIPVSSVMNALGYYYRWDSLTYTGYIYKTNYLNWPAISNQFDNSIYSNGLYSITANYDITTKNMIFSITLANPIPAESVVFTNDENNKLLQLTLPNTRNLLAEGGGLIQADINTHNITSVMSIENNLQTSISFLYSPSVNYYFSVSGNTINVYFSKDIKADYAISIPLPDGVLYSSLLSEDEYYNNSFTINIPGDLTAFYTTNYVSVNSELITSYNVEYNSGTNYTDISFSTNSFVGYKLFDTGESVSIKVGKPSIIYDKIVILDAGHGGKDPGAIKNKTNESDLNYTILYTLARKYFNAPDSPVKAYWTRTDDTFITLEDRAAFASKMNAHMFVSLHMNSANSSSAKGTEIYYSNNNNKPNQKGLTSYKLATMLIDSIVPAIGTNTRGVKSANYYVINHNTVPAVLIELGFLSNSTDFKIITNPDKQNKAAKAIYDAVVKAFSM